MYCCNYTVSPCVDLGMKVKYVLAWWLYIRHRFSSYSHYLWLDFVYTYIYILCCLLAPMCVGGVYGHCWIWSGLVLVFLVAKYYHANRLLWDLIMCSYDFNDVLTWWVPSNCYVELCSGCTCICVTVFWLACNCLSRYCASCVFSLLDSDCCL